MCIYIYVCVDTTLIHELGTYKPPWFGTGSPSRRPPTKLELSARMVATEKTSSLGAKFFAEKLTSKMKSNE